MSYPRLATAIVAVALTGVMSSAVTARDTTPGLAGGSVPLTEVLDVAKPYPNLVLQVRLQLVRANLKREQVTCSGRRFGNQWTKLGGARLAPYECQIGKQKLIVEAAQSYADVNGRKLKIADKDIMLKAATVKESSLKWKWK